MNYPAELIKELEREAEEWLADHPHRARNIFPKIEALLQCPGYQHALGFVGGGAIKDAIGHDAIDMLFCELFPEHLELATDFLNDRSELQLRHLFSAEHLRHFEQTMLCLLAIAVALRKDHSHDDLCPVSWQAVVVMARTLAALPSSVSAPSD